jgi:hypothetical protein
MVSDYQLITFEVTYVLTAINMLAFAEGRYTIR